jgi:hypothetical protein
MHEKSYELDLESIVALPSMRLAPSAGRVHAARFTDASRNLIEFKQMRSVEFGRYPDLAPVEWSRQYTSVGLKPLS